MNFTTAIIAGTVGGKIETKITKGGMTITNFSMFVSAGKNVDGTYREGSWFDMVSFDKTAQFAQKYAVKGAKLMAECAPKQQTWTNQEGKNMSKICFTVHRLHFTEGHQQTSQPQTLEQQAESEFGNFDPNADIAF